ncbi:unnamed protein product, partial [Musa acuminata var. zebrina]
MKRYVYEFFRVSVYECWKHMRYWISIRISRSDLLEFLFGFWSHNSMCQYYV